MELISMISKYLNYQPSKRKEIFYKSRAFNVKIYNKFGIDHE